MDRRSPTHVSGLRLALLAMTSALLFLGLDPVPVAASVAEAPLIKRSRMALGVSMPRCHDLAGLDAFTRSIGGNRPALWSVWVLWGHAGSREFPTAVMEGLRGRGVVPFVFWEPWNMDTPGDRAFRYARIAAGDHDDYLRRFARDARDFGGLVLLRFAGEANGGYFPWGVRGGLDNSVGDYKDAWRHIWRIFDAVGAANVRFVWSLVKQSCPGGCNPYAAFYPGHRFVDYMGFSSYNWGAIANKSWAGMYKGYRRVTRLLSAISAKPIIAAETGTNHVGGDKPAWIRVGYRTIHNEFPRIVAMLYLNYDLRKVGHPDWSLSPSGGGLGAYAKIAGLTGFKGRLTLRGS
jgi:hypothetical protein